MKTQRAYLYTVALGISLLLPTSVGYGQSPDMSKKLPADRKVHIGTLDNGLKYYIRQNKEPENRLELRLAVNAGSVLEDDDQRGMAHLVEHMGFNGSKNFKKNELVDYLQSIGMTFGADINAYTSFDETVYILQVPTDKQDILDKSFLVLKDWAHQLNFDPEEVDKERGVVVEEWRISGGAYQRVFDKLLPVIFRGSKYKERLPIGTKESIETTSLAAIKRFYTDWYRPDLMAVVLVGDVDVDWAEQKIKDTFSSMPASQRPREREKYNIPARGDTEVVIAKDKEFPGVFLFYISGLPETLKEETFGDYRTLLTEGLASSIVNNRLSKRSQEASPPFIGGGVGAGNFPASREGHALVAQITLDKEKVEEGIRAGLTEIWRAYQHGFHEGELEREKKNLKKAKESAYKERENTQSASYASAYVSNYLRQSSISLLSKSFEYRAGMRMIDDITLEEVHSAFKKLLARNATRTFAIGSNKDESIQIPSEERLLAIAEEIRKSSLAPYVYQEVAAQLLENKPAAGSVASKKEDTKTGVWELMLSNGARVLLKPTDFKDDEIQFSAWSAGGKTLVEDEDYLAAEMLPAFIREMGLGVFSQQDLEEVLAGKSIRISPYVSDIREGFVGNTNPKDLETFFELLHLHFTAPREDASAFSSLISKMKAQMPLVKAYPEAVYYDTISYVMAKGSARRENVILSDTELEGITLERVMRIHRERFSNARDYTFMFVGSFEMDKITPLLEQYIGSLPSEAGVEKWKDRGDNMLSQKARVNVRMGKEKSLVDVTYISKKPYDRKMARHFSMVNDMLNITLIEELREAESGVYSVRAFTGATEHPRPYYETNISFGCSAENVEKLIAAVEEEIKKLQDGRFEDKTLEKAKEKSLRDHEKGLKENSYWMRTLSYYDRRNLNPHEIFTYPARVKAVTREDIQKVAEGYIDLSNPIQVVLLPEAE